jgi:hypothetical protein
MTYPVKLDKTGYGLLNRYVFTNGMKNTFNNDFQTAGKDWVQGFLNCHKNLCLRVTEALSFARARGMSKEKVRKPFDHLSNLLNNHNLWDKPAKILNCDETGLQLI